MAEQEHHGEPRPSGEATIGFYVMGALQDKLDSMGVATSLEEADEIADQIVEAKSDQDFINLVTNFCKRKGVELDVGSLIEIAKANLSRIEQDQHNEAEHTRNILLKTIDDLKKRTDN